MKKKRFSRICISLAFPLCLFAACAAPAEEAGPPADEANLPEEATPAESVVSAETYTFPPDAAELQWAMGEAGLDWLVQERPDAIGEIGATQAAYYNAHLIGNLSGLVVGTINMRGLNKMDGRSGGLYLVYQKQTAEDYLRFQQEEWPLLWDMLGVLFRMPETFAALGGPCMDYFNSYDRTAGGQGTLAWCGAADGIYCTVIFFWHPGFAQYVLDSMSFDSAAPFDAEREARARSLLQNGYPRQLRQVADMEGGDAPAQYLAIGRVEQLEPNNDALDTAALAGLLPMNVDLYQKGLLVDESGNMTVYLPPDVSLLGEDALATERLHFLTVIPAAEPYCVLTLSSANLELAD